MKLLLVRHGESQGNLELRLQGRREYPLTARGIEQVRALAGRLAGAGLSAVYASPIRRAMDSATMIGEAVALEPQSIDGFQEYDFGDALSGLTWREISKKEPRLLTALVNNDSEFPHYPGEEGRSAFRQRVSMALRVVAQRHQANDTVAVVSHAGPIAVLVMESLHRAYMRPIPFRIDNASITTIQFNHGARSGYPQAMLVGLNDTCHLHHIETAADDRSRLS